MALSPFFPSPPPLPPASLPLSHSPLLFSPPSSLPPSPPLPQIVADDVKCTHGCTVSDLEEEELFYLRWARCACCAAPAVVGGVAGIVTRGGAHCACRARCGWLGLCCAVSPIKHHVHAPPAPIGSPYTPPTSPRPPPPPPKCSWLQGARHQRGDGPPDAGLLLWPRSGAGAAGRCAAGARGGGGDRHPGRLCVCRSGALGGLILAPGGSAAGAPQTGPRLCCALDGAVSEAERCGGWPAPA